MKEQKLLEMANKLNTLAQVCDRLIQENDFLKTVAMGDHAVIKKMPGFDKALKAIQLENETPPEELSKDDDDLTVIKGTD